MSGIMSAADRDSRERLRAFDAAVEHRAAMQHLSNALKLATTPNEAEYLVAEMRRVGDEYEAWMRDDAARMGSRDDQVVSALSNARILA